MRERGESKKSLREELGALQPAEQRQSLFALEAELVEKRRAILEKLSPEDREFLAEFDLSWETLRQFRKEFRQD